MADQPADMTPQTPDEAAGKQRRRSIFSWRVLVFWNLTTLVLLAVLFRLLVPRFVALARETGAALPTLTAAMVSVGRWLPIPVLAAIAAGLVLKEILVRPPGLRLTINVTVWAMEMLLLAGATIALWMALHRIQAMAP